MRLHLVVSAINVRMQKFFRMQKISLDPDSFSTCSDSVHCFLLLSIVMLINSYDGLQILGLAGQLQSHEFR